jgi:outer membrane protein assembly factor BamB/predicted nucleic acid-binding Zn ribbon protein
MNPLPEDQYWIICPVCHKPNPAGSRFCEHCWGAALHSDRPVSTEEMQALMKRHQAYIRRRKVIRRLTVTLVPLLILAAVVLPILYNYTNLLSRPLQDLNSSSAPEEWAMFHHDLSHSGAAGVTNATPQGLVEWAFTTDGAINSSPAVANGTVYFGSRDGKVYALDAASGQERWQYQTGSWVDSSPAVVGGIVYVGSNDGNLYALDANTGEELWTFKTAYPVVSSPAVAGGIVYFGSDDYCVYAVDAATGKKIWQFSAASQVRSSPAIAGGLIYVGSSGDYVYVLNALTGKLHLRFKTYASVSGSPTIIDHTALFACSGGFIDAVDGHARNWPCEYSIRPFWLQLRAMGLAPQLPPESGFLWSLALSGTADSSPAIAGDQLYVGSGNNLLAIDLKSHERDWVFETQGQVVSSPALSDAAVYVGSDDGRLYAIDIATGQQLWNFPTGDRITSSPAYANGTVYVGSHDGKLYAIR